MSVSVEQQQLRRPAFSYMHALQQWLNSFCSQKLPALPKQLVSTCSNKKCMLTQHFSLHVPEINCDQLQEQPEGYEIWFGNFNHKHSLRSFRFFYISHQRDRWLTFWLKHSESVTHWDVACLFRTPKHACPETSALWPLRDWLEKGGQGSLQSSGPNLILVLPPVQDKKAVRKTRQNQ